jgi:WD40 repeat protein
MVTSHFAQSTIPSQPFVSVQLWDSVPSAGEIFSTPHTIIHDRGGGTVEWSPDGERFAVLDRNGFLIYNVSTTSIENTVLFDEASPAVLRWSPDGSFLATGGSVIRIWDTETWEVVGMIQPACCGAYNLQWSPDSRYIFNDGGPDGLYMNPIPPEIALTPTP